MKLRKSINIYNHYNFFKLITNFMQYKYLLADFSMVKEYNKKREEKLTIVMIMTVITAIQIFGDFHYQ